MKKTLIYVLLLLAVATTLNAQPTITFTPSDGTTLTYVDVDSTLAANGLTRDSEFHAVSNAEIVGANAFYRCAGLTTVMSSKN